MNQYKISVIIPVYNVEPYIEACLQSVANQTMTDGIECILVDDCGTDNSVSLAEGFIGSYTGNIKFSLIHREQNGGLSAARNIGIQTALGEYLYFLDSDDEISPNCMELMWGLIAKYGKINMVQGSFYETEQEYKTLSSYQIPEVTNNRKVIKIFLLSYAGDIVGAQSRLIRKDVLVQHHLLFKEGIIHEDNHWTFFLAKYITSMAFCPVRTYYHRFNPTSITGNINVVNETMAYKTLVSDFCANIDNFLPGHQKELILNTLITALRFHYYEKDSDRDSLISTFARSNSFIERCMLLLYFKNPNSWTRNKTLHLLIRYYKMQDLW